MNKVALEKTTKEGKKLIIRYPKQGDAESMLEYINALSKEKTFIRLQGEQLTLKEEGEYLKCQLEKIEKNKVVQLLVFVGGRLVGISEITMKDKVEKHLGNFGVSIAKDFRGKGIGKLLMETVIREAKRQLPHLEIVILDVFASNFLAISLYEKLGFVKYGSLPKGIIYKNEFVGRIHMYKPV